MFVCSSLYLFVFVRLFKAFLLGDVLVFFYVYCVSCCFLFVFVCCVLLFIVFVFVLCVVVCGLLFSRILLVEWIAVIFVDSCFIRLSCFLSYTDHRCYFVRA